MAAACASPPIIAARNHNIASAVSARFALRETVISVVDLGCGTGANLRATCSLLPNNQTWRLVDSDEALLRAARDELSAWADSAETAGPHLHLKKGYATIWVEFAVSRSGDRYWMQRLTGLPALVTASALFDLDVRSLHPPQSRAGALIAMPRSIRC